MGKPLPAKEPGAPRSQIPQKRELASGVSSERRRLLKYQEEEDYSFLLIIYRIRAICDYSADEYLISNKFLFFMSFHHRCIYILGWF